MKKIDAFICGIASVFVYSNTISSNVLKKYPSNYEKSVQKSLSNSWSTVGKTLKGAIRRYGEKEKSSF